MTAKKSLLELISPAGTLAALKTAIDYGADGVYVGFRDNTNARHFAGLNLSDSDLVQGVTYVHRQGRKIFVAINTYPQPGQVMRWHQAVDKACHLGVDALILADPGLMAYARQKYPDVRLHLSVQSSATHYEAIAFYQTYFGIERAVLPRVLSITQIENVIKNTQVEIELFGFGGLCVMVEGRCLLSSYVCGDSPNTFGACSPGHAVRWQSTPQGMEVRLNGVLMDRYADHEKAGYPTLCKGRFNVEGQTYYTLEEPTSLNSMELLPEMYRMGVAAIKLEGRQRGPAYVGKVTKIWRAAIDAVKRSPDLFHLQADWTAELDQLSEGSSHTLGAYHRPWK